MQSSTCEFLTLKPSAFLSGTLSICYRHVCLAIANEKYLNLEFKLAHTKNKKKQKINWNNRPNIWSLPSVMKLNSSVNWKWVCEALAFFSSLTWCWQQPCILILESWRKNASLRRFLLTCSLLVSPAEGIFLLSVVYKFNIANECGNRFLELYCELPWDCWVTQ